MSAHRQPFVLAGGSPAFDEPLHVGRPNQPPRPEFLRRVEEALDRNWLSNNGPLVQEFEASVAELTATSSCVAVANGTMGLQTLLRAHDVVQPVAMPSFTFVATAAAAAWIGVDPALVDIEGTTHGIDPKAVAGVGADVGAIIGVHVWGVPCQVTELAEVARRLSCPLILDAAHALATTVDGTPVGGLGNAEVFSFHATKLVHSLEGGAVTTNDESLASEVRQMINFGFVGYDDVRSVGTNAKMNEISAAMGLAMLDHLPQVLEHNQSNRSQYERILADIPGISLATSPAGVATNQQYVIALIDEGRFGLSRDELYRFLHTENVLVRRYFHPGIHRLAPYKKFGGGRTFVETDRLAEVCLALPTGLSVDVSMIRKLGELIGRAQSQHALIARLLIDVPLP